MTSSDVLDLACPVRLILATGGFVYLAVSNDA